MTDIIQYVGQFFITSPEDKQEAERLAVEIKTFILEREEARKEITRPLDEAKRVAIAQERAVTQPYADALQHLTGELRRYQQAEEERVAQEQAEAEARMMKALEEGRQTDADEAMTDLTMISEPPRNGPGIGNSGSWSAEVTDMTQVLPAILRGDLPYSIIEPSSKGLTAYARQQHAQGEKNGVRVTYTRGISVGRK